MDAIIISRIDNRRGQSTKNISSEKVQDILHSLHEAESKGASEAELRQLSKQLVEKVGN